LTLEWKTKRVWCNLHRILQPSRCASGTFPKCSAPQTFIHLFVHLFVCLCGTMVHCISEKCPTCIWKAAKFGTDCTLPCHFCRAFEKTAAADLTLGRRKAKSLRHSGIPVFLRAKSQPALKRHATHEDRSARNGNECSIDPKTSKPDTTHVLTAGQSKLTASKPKNFEATSFDGGRVFLLLSSQN